MSLLITLEGIDGAGKSSLIPLLQDALSEDPAFNAWVYATKEPGSPLVASSSELRRMVLEMPDFKPFERELLFYVDASLHQRTIQSQQKGIFLSDRGLWSHLAYLRGYLKMKEMDYDEYNLCKQMISRVCSEPDCVVYMKGDLALMKERLQGKKKDLIEQNSEEFYGYVLETYDDLVVQREWDGKPLIVLDACDSFDNNIVKVVNYLKEVFTNEQLAEGNRELCGI